MRIVEALVPAPAGGTSQVSKRIGSYPRVRVSGDGGAAVSQAGGVLLVETARRVGLDAELSAALAPWRKPRAVHDPGKILLDLALAVALGGDCLSDVALLRAEPTVFGLVASDPTVSRLVDALAAAGPRACRGTRAATIATQAESDGVRAKQMSRRHESRYGPWCGALEPYMPSSRTRSRSGVAGRPPDCPPGG